VPPDERDGLEEAKDGGSLMAADGGGRHGWREEGRGEGWRRRMRRSAAAHCRVGGRCRGLGKSSCWEGESVVATVG
jgi:hypothetical protein